MIQADYSSAQAKLLFVLMNSAPAELLHPLTYAALQPFELCLFNGSGRYTGRTPHVFARLKRVYSPKKTPAFTPASEFLAKYQNRFPKKKPPYPTASDSAA
jgi:hypothetical protein